MKDGKREWKVRVEFVPFTSERQRERSYELYAESIINGYKNKLKFLEKTQSTEKILVSE